MTTTRSPETVCPKRRNGKRHAPLNHVLIADASAVPVEAYSSCSCGERFELKPAQRKELEAHLAVDAILPEAAVAGTLDDEFLSNTLPLDAIHVWSKQGIIPVGTGVLHRPTQPIPYASAGLQKFADHLLEAMRRAHGIGVAANQVGVGRRMFVHGLQDVAPVALVNPEVLDSSGRWDYTEGCLSLRLSGTAVALRRPRTVVVRASTPDRRLVVVWAEELLARVLQHEIDHLDGIEYVQRAVGKVQAELYARMANEGIDTALMPPRPY